MSNKSSRRITRAVGERLIQQLAEGGLTPAELADEHSIAMDALAA